MAGRSLFRRKRHIGVDNLGLLLAVWVTAASVSDNVGGIHLLSHIATDHPRVSKTPATARKPSTMAPASESTSRIAHLLGDLPVEILAGSVPTA